MARRSAWAFGPLYEAVFLNALSRRWYLAGGEHVQVDFDGGLDKVPEHQKDEVVAHLDALTKLATSVTGGRRRRWPVVQAWLVCCRLLCAYHCNQSDAFQGCLNFTASLLSIVIGSCAREQCLIWLNKAVSTFISIPHSPESEVCFVSAWCIQLLSYVMQYELYSLHLAFGCIRWRPVHVYCAIKIAHQVIA